MHIVLVYRYYNDGMVYYNLTFCTRKSLMRLGLKESSLTTSISLLVFFRMIFLKTNHQCFPFVDSNH